MRSFGGEVVFVDTQRETRAAKVAEVFARHPDAYLGSAFDDPLVIAGNASLGHELAALASAGRTFDAVVVPLGAAVVENVEEGDAVMRSCGRAGKGQAIRGQAWRWQKSA